MLVKNNIPSLNGILACDYLLTGWDVSVSTSCRPLYTLVCVYVFVQMHAILFFFPFEENYLKLFENNQGKKKFKCLKIKILLGVKRSTFKSCHERNVLKHLSEAEE